MNNGKPIFISDLGGVIYNYDADFNPEKHSERFQRTVAWYASHIPVYHNALQQYENGDVGTANDCGIVFSC